MSDIEATGSETENDKDSVVSTDASKEPVEDYDDDSRASTSLESPPVFRFRSPLIDYAQRDTANELVYSRSKPPVYLPTSRANHGSPYTGRIMQTFEAAKETEEHGNYQLLDDALHVLSVALCPYVYRVFEDGLAEIAGRLPPRFTPRICTECRSEKCGQPAQGFKCPVGVCDVVVPFVKAYRTQKPEKKDWAKTQFQTWSVDVGELMMFFVPRTTPRTQPAEFDVAALLYSMQICRLFHRRNVSPTVCSKLIGLRNKMGHNPRHQIRDECLVDFVLTSIDLMESTVEDEDRAHDVEEAKCYLLKRIDSKLRHGWHESDDLKRKSESNSTDKDNSGQMSNGSSNKRSRVNNTAAHSDSNLSRDKSHDEEPEGGVEVLKVEQDVVEDDELESFLSVIASNEEFSDDELASF